MVVNDKGELKYQAESDKKNVKYTCKASDDKFQITGNGKTWTGTYKVADEKRGKKDVVYNITLGDKTGLATASVTKDLKTEDEKLTLVISIDEYTLYFYETN